MGLSTELVNHLRGASFTLFALLLLAGHAAENREHLLQGAILLASGFVEGLLLYGLLRHGAWSAVLPAALAAVGPCFCSMTSMTPAPRPWRS